MSFILDSLSKSYSYIPKDNPKDRIHIEIGDSKDPNTFQPQVKLMRWDNEVNTSIRLKHDSISGSISYSYDGTKITWRKGRYKAVFYDKPTASGEGGIEFEIYLPKKPPINYLDFSVNTKELDWFYQPALTEQEIDDGYKRPENVVGSYAVYHKTKGVINEINGMEYKCGKAFHLYRPLVVDAKGNTIYGVLSLDETTSTLRLSVDQTWLNNAFYPVMIDPTFGYSTKGGSSSMTTADYLYGSVFTAPADMGTITNIKMFIDTGGPPWGYAKGAVVLHSNLNIVTNGVSAAGQWDGLNANPITGTYSSAPSVNASTDYVLCTIPNKSGFVYYDSGSTNQGHRDTSNSYTSPTNPTDAGHNSNKYSMYCTYTAGVSSSIKTVNGLAKASVKTVNGLAIASVKTMNGLA